MSFFLVFGAIFTAWTLLSVVGSERQKSLTTMRRKFAEQNKPPEPPPGGNKPHP